MAKAGLVTAQAESASQNPAFRPRCDIWRAAVAAQYAINS